MAISEIRVTLPRLKYQWGYLEQVFGALKHGLFQHSNFDVVPIEEFHDKDPLEEELRHMAEDGSPRQVPELAGKVTQKFQKDSVDAEHDKNEPEDPDIVEVVCLGGWGGYERPGVEEDQDNVEDEVNEVVEGVDHSADCPFWLHKGRAAIAHSTDNGHNEVDGHEEEADALVRHYVFRVELSRG